MLYITLKNIFRSNLKNFRFTLITIAGLSLALTAFLFITKYVIYERSFDTFYEDSDQVYRINRTFTNEEEVAYYGSKSPRAIYYAKDQMPEIEQCGFSFYESCQVQYESFGLNEQAILWVSEDFEKVFSFDMVKGTVSFDRDHIGVISESAAKSVFGNQDPIGKIIKVNEGMPIEITGIFHDLPSNTHIQADYFVSAKPGFSTGG